MGVAGSWSSAVSTVTTRSSDGMEGSELAGEAGRVRAGDSDPVRDCNSEAMARGAARLGCWLRSERDVSENTPENEEAVDAELQPLSGAVRPHDAGDRLDPGVGVAHGVESSCGLDLGVSSSSAMTAGVAAMLSADGGGCGCVCCAGGGIALAVASCGLTTLPLRTYSVGRSCRSKSNEYSSTAAVVGVCFSGVMFKCAASSLTVVCAAGLTGVLLMTRGMVGRSECVVGQQGESTRM